MPNFARLLVAEFVEFRHAMKRRSMALRTKVVLEICREPEPPHAVDLLPHIS